MDRLNIKGSIGVFSAGVLSALLMALPAMGYSGMDSSIVVEAHSGKVLFEQASQQRRPIAGLTQMATAAVVIDWAKVTQASLNQYIVLPGGASLLQAPNPLGIQVGDQITIRDALYSMLLGSDYYSAFALSSHVGQAINQRRGHSHKTGEETFVREMNQLAQSLGMNSTKFVSAHGLSHKGHAGYSTAGDVARLGIYLARKPSFAFYVKQKSRSISFLSQGSKRSFKLKNTNALLGQGGVIGMKAASSPLAGNCLATSAERAPLVRKLPNNRTQLTPRRLIAVTLGSAQSFQQTRQLLQHGWIQYEQWINQQSDPRIPQGPYAPKDTFLRVANPF